MVATSSSMATNETGGGISLDIYWLSSPCRLSQDGSFKGQIEGKGPKTPKTMAKSHLALVMPATVIGTVEPHSRPPKRVRNVDVRAREYLTNAEVDRLIKAAGANGHRDATASGSLAI
jgi:hypothetical protein